MNIILINAHGGMIDGKYVTPGKRSPVWPDGRQYFEGVGNREIVCKLHNLCFNHGIDSVNLVPEQEDISLAERVRRADAIYAKRKDSIIIEIHSDAFHDETANGFTVFTSKGKTKSDEYAKIIEDIWVQNMPDVRNRQHKEMNFKVISQAKAPAVLIETMFHTNERECKILMDEQDRVVSALFECILGLKKYLGA